MHITKELVEYISELSRIELKADQKEKIEKDLNVIINYMDILNKLDTSDVEPMSHVFSVSNVMRDDVVLPSFDRDRLLSNAPKHNDESVIVPKVVD